MAALISVQVIVLHPSNMSFLEQIYAPQNTTSDILSATYSIWNILNYVAQSRDKKYRYQRGHIRPIQAEALLNMVRRPT